MILGLAIGLVAGWCLAVLAIRLHQWDNWEYMTYWMLHGRSKKEKKIDLPPRKPSGRTGEYY